MRRPRGAWEAWAGLLLALLCLLPPAGVLAGEAGVSHERARKAVEAGEIMPLHEILSRVNEQYQGRVLEVKLEDQTAGLQGWVYSIRLLSPQDNVLSLQVDAGTATILGVQGAGQDAARPEGAAAPDKPTP